MAGPAPPARRLGADRARGVGVRALCGAVARRRVPRVPAPRRRRRLTRGGRARPGRRRRRAGAAHAPAQPRGRGLRRRGRRPTAARRSSRPSARRPTSSILDVTMPGLDGLAVCRRLRAKGLRGAILMLTARDAVADRVAGLEAGADDYLVKPFAIEELVARMRALTRRGHDGADRLAFADLTLDLRTRVAERGGRERRADRARERAARAAAPPPAGGRAARPGDRGDLGRRRRRRTWSTATSPGCAASSASRRSSTPCAVSGSCCGT